VTAYTKPGARKREPALIAVGYSTQEVRRRQARPVHARREEILAEAEAVFKPKNKDQTGNNDRRTESNYWTAEPANDARNARPAPWMAG
jgi:hypothetical protein